MSRTQRLVSRFLPRSWVASMEAESRQWMVRCPACGFERSIWDLGGIRWKARGTKRIFGRCPNCRKLGWFKVYRKDEAASPSAL